MFIDNFNTFRSLSSVSYFKVDSVSPDVTFGPTEQ